MLFTKARRGFTLIEIAIVIVIIGILLALAIPNVLRAQAESRAKECVANLKQIDSAKSQWEMDNRAKSGEMGPTASYLEEKQYLKKMPLCPDGGKYIIGDVGNEPSCSYDNEKLPFRHRLP